MGEGLDIESKSWADGCNILIAESFEDRGLASVVEPSSPRST